MKQKHWIIFISLAFIALFVTGIYISQMHMSEIRTLSKQNEDMTVKLDELDVKLESLTASSRITNSALKEDEQRIKALEEELSEAEAAKGSGKDPVNLVWYMYSEPQKLKDWPEVEKALNEYSAEKIGVTCQFMFLDKDVVANTALNAEEYDIAYTCNWWNDFQKNVASGNFLDLTDEVSKYPKLKGTILDSVWSCAKFKDRIYAIPHMKDIGCEIFWILDTNYFLKEKGFEKDQYISFEEIEPYLKAYKEDHPDDYPIKIASSGLTSWQVGLVDWMNMDVLVGLDWDEQGTSREHVIKCALEIPAWRERLRTIHKWYELGYINEDAPELESYPRDRSGVVQSGQGWFGAETVWANVIKKPIYIARFDGPYMCTSAVQAMTAVSAYTKHPEEAMKLIELMNTDPWYRETARYGIEGKHYIRNYDGTVIRTTEGVENMNVQAYTQGHTTLGALEASQFPEVPTDTHQWEKTLASYANATVSAAMGFTPDLNPVADECEAIKSVINNYRPTLYTGKDDPDKVLPDMLKDMEKAGLRKVMDEIQRQLDAYLEGS